MCNLIYVFPQSLYLFLLPQDCCSNSFNTENKNTVYTLLIVVKHRKITFEKLWENTNQEYCVHREAQVNHPSHLPLPLVSYHHISREHHGGCATTAEREHEQVVLYYL